jgi:hypothetical protein
MSAPSGVAVRLAVAVGLLAVLRSSRHALADDQVVGDCGDSGGADQLRAKLVAAQSTGGGAITFPAPRPFVLDGTVLPTITGDLTIDGGNQITISAGNASRIFVANAGATLTLNNITLTKGFSDADGGAIRNAGTLLINSSRLTDNQTTLPWSGGAIFSTGELNVTNSEFDHNKAGNGGALMLYHSGATATITGSSFHDNETTNATNGWGGAILLFDGASAKGEREHPSVHVHRHDQARLAQRHEGTEEGQVDHLVLLDQGLGEWRHLCLASDGRQLGGEVEVGLVTLQGQVASPTALRSTGWTGNGRRPRRAATRPSP